jgi:hypothetical protein
MNLERRAINFQSAQAVQTVAAADSGSNSRKYMQVVTCQVSRCFSQESSFIVYFTGNAFISHGNTSTDRRGRT